MCRLSPLFLMVCLAYASSCFAQDTLYLVNPSFEDNPRHSRTPQGWTNQGFPKKSPPDIGPTDQFYSTIQPAHGQSFLVLITRDDNTWERVSGELSGPLSPEVPYRLEVKLARSASYLSQSPIVKKDINFAFPVCLRLWGSTDQGEARELLAMTPPVKHTDWQPYTLIFQASRAYSHLLLEAYYAPEASLPYPGNLCIDQLSPLMRIDEEVPQASAFRLQVPPVIPKTPSEQPSVKPIDITQLQQILAKVRPGEVEQGIYELAIYQRSIGYQEWTICVYDDGSKVVRRFKRQLKKQIRDMELTDYLKVDDYVSAFQHMKWIYRPEDGSLGIR